MAQLKIAVDTAVAEHGFPEENRPFRPHVTLGRVKDQVAAGDLKQSLNRAAQTSLGTMQVREAAFIRSTLTRRGPVYEDLYLIPLGTM